MVLETVKEACWMRLDTLMVQKQTDNEKKTSVCLLAELEREKQRVEDIQKLCPDANVIEDIFETERNDISGKSKEIGSWLEEIGIKK